MVSSRPTTRGSKPKNVKGSNSEDCPCRLYIDAIALECEKCGSYWHVECAGLKGLTKDGCDALDDWLCPKCFVSPYVTRDFSPENCKSIVELMAAELVTSSPLIASQVNELLKETVENAVTEKVESNIKNHGKRVEEVIEKARATDVKKWSSMFQTDVKTRDEQTKQTVANSVKEAVTTNQSTLIQAAVTKGQSIQDINQMERDSRRRNIVVSNVKESKDEKSDTRINEDWDRVLDLLGELAVQEKEICKVVRAGPRKTEAELKEETRKALAEKRRPRLVRPLIVTVVTPRLAEDLHVYGSGRKLTYEGVEHWINPDLIRVDREAQYNARKLKKERDAIRSKTIRDKKSVPDEAIAEEAIAEEAIAEEANKAEEAINAEETIIVEEPMANSSQTVSANEVNSVVSNNDNSNFR